MLFLFSMNFCLRITTQQKTFSSGIVLTHCKINSCSYFINLNIHLFRETSGEYKMTETEILRGVFTQQGADQPAK